MRSNYAPIPAGTQLAQAIATLMQQDPSQLPAFPMGPLSGRLVVGIVEHVAGPVALGILVSDGAFGLTLEPPTGDPARTYLTHECFSSFHAGKMSLAMDLKVNPDYLKVLSQAEIIIDNRSKRARDNDAVLKQFLADPNKSYRVIYCHISGYPGVAESQSGNDVTVQASSGLAYANGPGVNQPLKVGTSILDFLAALWAVIGIQSRLIQMLSGIPIADEVNNVIPVHVTLAGAAAQILPTQYLLARKGVEFPQRINNIDGFVSVFSFFKTLDELYISIGTLTDASFKVFCDDVIGLPELAIRFPTNKIRLANNQEIHAGIMRVIASKTRDYWLEKLGKTSITHSKVNTALDVVKEPYAGNLFAKTNDGTSIVARADGLKPALDAAPKVNQHGRVFSGLLKSVCAAKNYHSFYENSKYKKEAVTSEEKPVESSVVLRSKL